MMGKCQHRKMKKRRYSHKTSHRAKFLTKGDDDVYEELQKPDEERKPLPLDEDLPGMGQFYDFHCYSNNGTRGTQSKAKKKYKAQISNYQLSQLVKIANKNLFQMYKILRKVGVFFAKRL
ncbi:uncharacterized protein LOC127811884 [Diospyros lotus]|uniref:uncharacterized protein LOC127811884 n=1 Tax=Diospyros lotus TaxID=55363 RepID=UPI0022570954|nr:uncharacterized protein LOC127811884 [Diospyros lotus]